MKIKSAFLFDTGMIVSFDERGEQVPHLQGPYSIEIHAQILAKSDHATEWNGFDQVPTGWERHAREKSDLFQKYKVNNSRELSTL